MAKKKDIKPVGRPPKIDNVILGKLEGAFKIGANDREACSYAGINPDTLYEYQKKHPEFTEQKEAWKQNPIMKAKNTIFSNLDDPKTAQWYLEKKCANEFSGNQINTNIINVNNQNLQITKKDLDEAVNLINELR